MKQTPSILRRVTIGCLCILLLWVVIAVGASRERAAWTDSISGSMKRQTIWIVGYETPARLEESPLEHAYRRLHLQWQPDWHTVQGDQVNFFTAKRSHSHGQAPPILMLQSPDLQTNYLATASDDDIQWFFKIMTTATAPPIYYIHGETLLRHYVEGSTDNELRTFFIVMTTGSKDEQKAAVEAAGEAALEHMHLG